MSKFSRGDIRKFFKDTLAEAYGEMPYFGQTLNDGPPDAPEEDPSHPFEPEYYDDEPDVSTIRGDTARYREDHPRQKIPVHVPDESGFEKMLRQRRRRQGLTRESLREMIEEAILFSTSLAPDQTEFYPDDYVLDDPDFQEELKALDRAGHEVYFSPSGDAMDTDMELHGDLGRMEREMMDQGRYPHHHHDDDYSDLDDMEGLDIGLDDSSTAVVADIDDDLYYSDMEELVMERKQIRQMISDVLKQG